MTFNIGPFLPWQELSREALFCWQDFESVEDLKSEDFLKKNKLIERQIRHAVVDGTLTPYVILKGTLGLVPTFIGVSKQSPEFKHVVPRKIYGPVPISREDCKTLMDKGTVQLDRIPESRIKKGYIKIQPSGFPPWETSDYPSFKIEDLHFEWGSVGIILRQLKLEISNYEIAKKKTRVDPIRRKIVEFLTQYGPNEATIDAVWTYVLEDPLFDEGLKGIVYTTFEGELKTVNRENFAARLQRLKKITKPTS